VAAAATQGVKQEKRTNLLAMA
jgi:hypothetical protein